jgi:RNA polymerase sigma-70 factor (ECF subfamily)
VAFPIDGFSTVNPVAGRHFRFGGECQLLTNSSNLVSMTMAKKSAIFADLLLKSSRDLFGFIYSLVQNLPDAEDVYQETSLVLWQKFDEFTIGTNFTAWAMRIAHFRALKHIEAKRKQRLFLSEELLDSVAEAYQREALGKGDRRAAALTACIEKLSEKERQLVERCYAPDRNYAEIARVSGRTIGAVYQAINRIRKTLFACIERTMALEGR